MPGVRISWDRRRAVWDCLVEGFNPNEAARVTGVSKTCCYDLHHSVERMYRPVGTGYDSRYLSRDDRYEIARLLDDEHSQAEVARRLRRDAATISREIRRNRDPRTGRYLPEKADRLAWERQRRPKASKLSQFPELRAEVQKLLNRRFSPDQIAGRLKVEHADNEQMQISHEAIYQSIFVYPRGELTRELKACLRSGRAVRRPRGQRRAAGGIKDAVSIHDRPEEVEGRLVPGHHEGDLVMGSTASNSAVATIVERQTGLLNLLHLPDGHTAPAVAAAVTARVKALPDWFTKSLTWDRGLEMARHKLITAETDLQVYFADPYSPWQRGTNENTNGLVREYLPKGTDLSTASADHLAWVENELNERPRKRLGYLTPKEAYATLLLQDIQTVVATMP